MSESIRILVAEDHLVARVGVGAIVNVQPDMTIVAEASNGVQAVEQFRRHRPDALTTYGTEVEMSVPLL